ncbi:putative lipase/esterase [Mycolicibacterium cosmeticum]|uniref:Lipase/esterase n=1 Tax=Mycolicibacterium cosmeticum TaxID=258533 RepID=W9AZ59_MYCCO|nr:putative lipase/esterase [Mycolicibacterium cosmeticum]
MTHGHGVSVFHRTLRLTSSIVVRPLLEHAHPSGWQLRGLRTLFRTVTAAASLRHETAQITQIHDLSNEYGPISGEWINAAGVTRLDTVILYLHGGGYISTSAAHYRGITTRLSAITGLPVFAANYRLAPENRYPAALHDAVAAYRWLCNSGAQVVVAGDSAGAHLSTGLTVEAITADLPLPRALVLLSPLLDISCREAVSVDRSTPDPLMAPAFAMACAQALGVNNRTRDPRVAPLEMDDGVCRGFPPTLSVVAGAECFRGDAARLHERLLRNGVSARTYEMPGHIHDFMLFAHTGAARTVLRWTADFLAAHTHTRTWSSTEGRDR